MCPHASICQAQLKKTLRSAGILRLFWRDRGRWRYSVYLLYWYKSTNTDAAAAGSDEALL